MDRKVSVIVPVYNVEKYIDRCIESIVSQSYKNIEIILVDDGSPDNCPRICDSWAEKDSRIKVVHKENGGLSDARNTGMRHATGELLMFVDSDDTIDINAVSKLENYINDEDFIVAEALIYENDGRTIHRDHTNLEENRIYSGKELAAIAISKGEWFAPACYNFYNRDFLMNNNLFFVVGILHEDNEYQTRLFLAANKVKYMHFEFYNYIKREGSICNSLGDKNVKDLFQTYERWIKLNEGISEKNIYDAYCGALCKAFIHTCREYKLDRGEYPKGITNGYLIKHALNTRELMKTVSFILFRRIYVRL